MILSRQRRFLLIHIEKTGGTSLRAALRRGLPDCDEKTIAKHATAREAQQLLGAEWDQLHKVSMVRNPWDRLVSHYFFAHKRTVLRPWYKRILGRRSSHEAWRAACEGSADFDHFVRRTADLEVCAPFYRNQIEHLCDDNGQLMVDYIGRYESYDRDAAVIFRSAGVPEVRLPKKNATRHPEYGRHYSTYYTDLSRDIVARKFALDIEKFGYRFEDRRG